MCKSSNWIAVGFSCGPCLPPHNTEHWICRKGRFNILYTLHAPNNLKKTAFFTLMNSPERKWECQSDFCDDVSNTGPLPLELWPPQRAAILDREYVLLMVSRFLAWKPCIVGRMKGSLFSLSLLSVLSDIIYSLCCSQHRWHSSLPVELQNNVNELMSFFTVGALFLDRMVCNSEQRPFVSRQEITSLFCLCSILGLWNCSVDTIIGVLT